MHEKGRAIANINFFTGPESEKKRKSENKYLDEAPSQKSEKKSFMSKFKKVSSKLVHKVKPAFKAIAFPELAIGGAVADKLYDSKSSPIKR